MSGCVYVLPLSQLTTSINAKKNVNSIVLKCFPIANGFSGELLPNIITPLDVTHIDFSLSVAISPELPISHGYDQTPNAGLSGVSSFVAV